MTPSGIVRLLSHPLAWKVIVFVVLAAGAYATADLRLRMVESTLADIKQTQKEDSKRIQVIAERLSRIEGVTETRKINGGQTR